MERGSVAGDVGFSLFLSLSLSYFFASNNEALHAFVKNASFKAC